MKLREPPPLSLYVHFPWCVRKCPYCDFNSHEVRGDLPEQDYLQALLRDLAYERARVPKREVISVFIGGGTPSLLSGEALSALLDGIRGRLRLGAEAEITLESNPGTLTVERLRDYQHAGVNRLSIGVQSLRDPQLASLGRIHSGEEARRAFHAAREAGFDNINLDLMFGLPEDTREGALYDLTQAIALAPEHLSWYQLTIEPNTAFFRRPPPLPDDDALWEIYQDGQAALAAHGYVQYEVSAYARGEHHCRHNLNYWRFGDYLGIGAGAHGKISDAVEQRIVRTAKRRNPKIYMHGAGTAAAIQDERRIGADEIIVEFMINALRLRHGFPSTLFNQHTGLPIEIIEPSLIDAAQRGLIDYSAGHIQPTALGLRYLNELVYLFYDHGTNFKRAV